MNRPLRWTPLSTELPQGLDRTRHALQHAARVVVAWPSAHGGPQTPCSLRWDASRRALVSAPAAGFSAGLAVADGAWLVLDAQGEELDRLDLAGRTLGEGLAFVRRVAAAHDGPSDLLTLGAAELPEHAVHYGASFLPLDTTHLELLATWMDDAHALLARVGGEDAVAVCFPRPRLVTEVQGLTVGMALHSPGLDEPSFFVEAPPPRAEAVELPVGHWHDQGWQAAVLTASELPETEQREVIGGFLEAAVAALS